MHQEQIADHEMTSECVFTSSTVIDTNSGGSSYGGAQEGPSSSLTQAKGGWSSFPVPRAVGY